MIIQIILNALIGLQLNIFAFVMIMQDEQKQKKKKHLAEKSRIESQKLSLRHMPKLVSFNKIHLEIRLSCLGPTVRG